MLRDSSQRASTDARNKFLGILGACFRGICRRFREMVVKGLRGAPSEVPGGSL